MVQRGFQQRRLHGETRFAGLYGGNLLRDAILGFPDERDLPTQRAQHQRQTDRGRQYAESDRDRLAPPACERGRLGAGDIDDDRVERQWMDRGEAGGENGKTAG